MKARAFAAAYPGVVLSATVLFLGLLSFVFAVHEFRSARALQEEAGRQQRKAAAESVRAMEAAALVRLAESHAGLLASLDRKLVTDVGEGALLAAVQSLARSSDVRLAGFRIEVREPLAGLNCRVAYVELEGDYTRIRAFIHRVQELPAAALVANAILERQKGGRELRATLEVETFSVAGGSHAAGR